MGLGTLQVICESGNQVAQAQMRKVDQYQQVPAGVGSSGHPEGNHRWTFEAVARAMYSGNNPSAKGWLGWATVFINVL